ncbi:MAG TPA: polysaccharide deacetylase family protein [Cyclobacteriaceae bacterium]
MGLKQSIAKILSVTGITSACFYLSKLVYGTHIRVVNYHGTPKLDAINFEAQLEFYKRHYVSVSRETLDLFFSRQWKSVKPGLIISFDDGYRDNYDVAMPLLEKHGFVGWFFIPSGLIESCPDEQTLFAGRNKNRLAQVYPDGRYLMTWDELKKLSQKHVIGCHTFSHHRMNEKDGEEILEKEIVYARQLLEEKLQQVVDIYCWVGGEEHTYTHAAAEKIKQAGYKYSFMTNTYPVKQNCNPLQLQRSNIESDNSLPLVRFQLSALMDIVYYGKRKRVNRITL